MVKIRIPGILNSITKTKLVEIDIGQEDITVKQVIAELSRVYGPEFERKILEDGKLRRFVNIYLNGEDIRYLNGLDTEVKNSSELSILPAVSGG